MNLPAMKPTAAPPPTPTPPPTIVTHWRDVPRALRGAAVAIGNFDGVHRGHAAVLRAAHVGRPDLPLAALTFEPHPREHFRPEDPPFRLTLLPAKAEALAALGAQIIYALPFDAELAAMPAEEFWAKVLVQGLGARHLSCGADFAFGHRRGGDVGLLAHMAEAAGIGLTVVPAITDGSGPISSTRIRRLLQDGYPERAAAELGHPFAITGLVHHGDARGRLLGFPTANTPLGRHVEPARGVYAVMVSLRDGRRYAGVANLGRRPTLGGDPESRLETHLFDFKDDLYGQTITVELHHFLRPEQRFNGLPELQAQIATDAQQARQLLTASPAATNR